MARPREGPGRDLTSFAIHASDRKLQGLPLIQALVVQHRRFLKPLRYDARRVSEFANALLLDAGPAVVPLHLLSPFMGPTERAAKERAIAARGTEAWVWRTEDAMPPLPAMSTLIPG